MKGLWIPNYIFLKSGLTPTEKCVLSIIVSFEKCYMGNNSFAEMLELKPLTISNIISSFKKRGIVSIYFEGTKRIISVASLKNELNDEGHNEMTSFKNVEPSFKNEHIDKDKKERKKKKKAATTTDFFSIEENKKEEEEEKGRGGGLDGGGFESAQPLELQLGHKKHYFCVLIVAF